MLVNDHSEDQKNTVLIIPHYKVLSLIVAGTMVSWIGFLMVLSGIDPYMNPALGPLLFLGSLFLSLTGSFGLILFFLKKWQLRNEVYLKHISISMRQGMLMSLVSCLAIGLEILGLLRLWNGVLILLLMVLIEFYLSGKNEV